jgi:hypothetical protein
MGKNVGVLVRAVVEPCEPRKDETLIISLVLQPDDSTDRGSYGGEDIDLSKWPSEIASRLRDGSIEIVFYCSDGQERRTAAERVQWIPLAVSNQDLEERDELWKTAIGRDVLAGFETQTGAQFVQSKVLDRLRIYASPVDKLALAAQAMTSTSVFAQLAAHEAYHSGSPAMLSGVSNPLAKKLQQSRLLFNLFEGAQPDAPPSEDKDFVIDISQEDYEALSKDTSATVRRLENFALVNPDPSPRVDPFFPQQAKTQSIEEDHTGRYCRISGAMRQRIQKAMAQATVNAGRKSLRRNEYRGKPDDEGYFSAAVAAFSAISHVKVSASKDHRIDPGQDYAEYLLSMQPDDKNVVEKRIYEARLDGSDVASAAIRTIAGMYEYPALAAFFGLVVDVAIKRSEIPENACYMRVELYSKDSALPFNSKIWTAVTKHARRLEMRARHPCGPAARVSNGLLHLNEDERFSIISLDVNAAIEGGLNAARNDYQAKLDGVSNSELSSSLPAQRGVGLAIVDRWRWEAARDEVNLTSEPESLVPPDDPRILYLEDLIAGYRIDVLTDQRKEAKHGWLTLMDRDVHFPKLEKALKKAGFDSRSLSRQPEWGVDRLAGTVQSMHREVQSNEGQAAVVFETLATWRNWSLAVPSRGGYLCLDKGELQLDRRISPRPASLPLYRFGSKVKFGARVSLINGSSITLDHALEHYYASPAPYLLSDGNGLPKFMLDKGFPVLRHEPLATPRVFLPWATPLADSEVNPPIHEIIVSKATPRAARIVLPGEVSLETAELHGVLDSFDILPPRPFIGMGLTPPIGKAPSDPVKGGDLHNDVPSYPDPAAHLLVLGFTESGEPADGYGFPPPLTIDLYGSNEHGREYKWPDAAAISVELDAVASEDLPLGGRISGDFASREPTRAKNGQIQIKVRLLPAEQIDLTVWALPRTLNDFAQFAPFAGAMQLASFDTVLKTGLLSSTDQAPKLGEALRKFEEISAPGRSMKDKGTGLEEILLRAFKTLPVPALTGHQVLRLVHAVEKPLAAPAFINLWAMHNPAVPEGQEDHDVRLRRAWAKALLEFDLDAEERPSTTGSDVFAKAGKTFTQGSNRAFFGGEISFHRKSTGRVDLMGFWVDCRDDITPRRDPTTGKYYYLPEPHAETLATIDGIDYRVQRQNPNEIGMALDEVRKPTYLSYTFRDTRARKLTINARAVSRFNGKFKMRRAAGDEDFCVSSENTSGGDVEVIILSTERPKPLEALFCLPSLHYSMEHYTSAGGAGPTVAGVRHTRTVRMRFDLGDRFWCTGCEERVGVVCWPPDLFNQPEIPLIRQIQVQEVDQRIVNSIDTGGGGVPPEGAADCVTRWGRDPIHDGGDLPALIPASAFRNAVKSAKCAMPLPSAKKQAEQNSGVNSTLEVSVALYDPVLDQDTGHYYVDIEVDQNTTYEPWVRIGLVRYQEHSIQGLECSVPVPYEVRIPADRQLECEVDDGGRVSVRYSGVAYHDSGVTKDAGAGLLPETTTLDITVMHSAEDGTSGAPVILKGDQRGSGLDGSPHIKQLKPRVTDGISEWVVGRFADGAPSRDPEMRELVLLSGWDPAKISILVEEREYAAADDPRKNPTTHCPSGFDEPLSWSDSAAVDGDPETVIASRIVSAARIPLRFSSHKQSDCRGDEREGGNKKRKRV